MTHTSTEQERSAFLPCPFCGGRSEFNEHDELCYFTKLAELKAKPASADLTPMLELLEAWNRRTTASQAQRVPLSAKQRQAIFDDLYPHGAPPETRAVFAAIVDAIDLHGITQEKQE